MIKRELGWDMIGAARPCHVMTEDPVDPAAIVGKGQSQPKQYDVVAPFRWPADGTVRRQTLIRDASMDASPIRRAIPGKHLADALPRDFFAVDVPQPRPGQPKQALVEAVPEIDQPEMRKETRHFERIEIGPRRHGTLTGRLQPIIEEFTLSLCH
jgi:hypothetical protein